MSSCLIGFSDLMVFEGSMPVVSLRDAVSFSVRRKESSLDDDREPRAWFRIMVLGEADLFCKSSVPEPLEMRMIQYDANDVFGVNTKSPSVNDIGQVMVFSV